MKPRISIIVTCYNLGAYLPEALDSLSGYPHKEHYEVILIDDGSTDPETIRILDGLDTSRYRVVRQANMGLAKARNNGIRMAQGEYIIPLDADNRLRPAMIESVLSVLDAEADVDIVYGDAEYFGERTGRRIVGEFDFRLLLERNRIDACAGFRKSLWERMGGYDEEMPHMGLEDWDLWLRASVAGYRFHYIPEVLFDYRVRDGSMLVGTVKNMEQIEAYIFNKPELRFLGSLRSSYLMLLADSKSRKVLTGRDHLRLLLAQAKARIFPN